MAVLDLERWSAASPYLDRALELDDAEREALLDGLQQKDPALAADVRRLLASHRAVLDARFLEDGPASLPDLQVAAGQAIGPYQLVAPIGEGGMGTVWLAERRDGRFERRVAIKLLNVGLVGLPGGQRFLREGALLAQLRHPHIAELIDAGVLPGGRPYLVLEFVDGQPIDLHCDRLELDIEARVRLLLDVAAAVEHAHAHLIVHRDLKPANVLVTAEGDVKLLDFGIAKLLAGDERRPVATLTREGGAALTPEYASPEQVSGETVSTATDVYALGLLLYLLVCGRHPIAPRHRTPAGVVRAILDEVPMPPSEAVVTADGEPDEVLRNAARRGSSPERLRRALQGDLDTIVARALRKDPSERYLSVGALAADLQRFLAHEPISARPDTLGYRLRKFVRRNRALVVTSAVALLATIGGVTATLVQANLARQERDFALQQLERAESLNDLNHFLLVDAAPGGRPFTVNELLERAEQLVSRQRSGDATQAGLLIGIGGQYGAQDEMEAALRVLEQAYVAAQRSAVPSLRAQAACNLAEVLALSGQPDRARQLLDEGLALLPDDARHGLERAGCLLRASRVAREIGSPDEAIALAQAAQEARARSPYRSEMLDLRAVMDLAESYNQAGRFRQATAAFAAAAERLAALGRDDTATAGTLYNNWALTLTVLGRPVDAEPLFRRAIELSRVDATNDAVSPMLLVNYARALREIGRLDEAMLLAEQGNDKAVAAGHAVVVNQSLLLLASIYRELGRLDQAGAALSEVEPRLRAALPPGHYAFASLAAERAELELALGNGDGARRLADEAVAIAEADQRSTGRTHPVPRMMLRRAEIILELGDAAQAAQEARAALALLRDDAAPDLRTGPIGEASLVLGRALLQQGSTVDAEAALAAAVDNLESAVGPAHPSTQLAHRLAEGRAGG